jgi:phosphate transport system protein
MVVEHTVKAFDKEMTILRGLIAEMGGLAELAIGESIDALEAQVDQLAVQVIALRAPVADDLREVIAALKIAGILERVGDYAKNIAKRVSRIEDRKIFEPLTLIPAMAEVAGEMVRDVLTAYAARDAAAASEVIERDAKVDAFYDSIFRNMVSFMMENPSTITSAAHLLFIARNIERIGDHATNIAEQVYYAATANYADDRTERPEN